MSIDDEIREALAAELEQDAANVATEVVLDVLDRVAFAAEPFLARQVQVLRDQCETLDKRVLSKGFEIVALAESVPNRLPRIVCPACRSDIAATKTGRVRLHRHEGFVCPASGTMNVASIEASA